MIEEPLLILNQDIKRLRMEYLVMVLVIKDSRWGKLSLQLCFQQEYSAPLNTDVVPFRIQPLAQWAAELKGQYLVAIEEETALQFEERIIVPERSWFRNAVAGSAWMVKGKAIATIGASVFWRIENCARCYHPSRYSNPTCSRNTDVAYNGRIASHFH